MLNLAWGQALFTCLQHTKQEMPQAQSGEGLLEAWPRAVSQELLDQRERPSPRAYLHEFIYS